MKMGHIVNRDILIQTIAGVMASAIVTMANIFSSRPSSAAATRDGEGGGVNPIAALAMALLALWRPVLCRWPFRARGNTWLTTRGQNFAVNPWRWLALWPNSARPAGALPMREGNPSTEQMFIVSPMFAHSSMANLFSTHPPLEERIRRLQAMAASRLIAGIAENGSRTAQTTGRTGSAGFHEPTY